MSMDAARLSEACDGLVHPSVTEKGERARQRRLIGIALGGPLLVSAGCVQTLAPGDIPLALAMACSSLVLGWTAAVAVAQSGSRKFAGPALLFCAIFPLALLMASAGGAASPYFLSFLPLVLEPYFVSRTRAALLAGLSAGAAALVVGLTISWDGGAASASAAAWYWTVPLMYLATVWFRRELLSAHPEKREPARLPLSSPSYPAVFLRMNRNGDVAECSPEARSLLGLEPEFLLANGLIERVHVADRIAFLEAVADLREGQDYRKVELRLRLPVDMDHSGRSTYRPFALELIREETCDTGFIAIVRDNAEVADLRGKLEEARERSEVEKLRFLATVSHELRTPLNAIIGFSDMLLNEIAGPFANERQREYTGLVRESGEHLLSVVNAILDVAKIEAGTYAIRKDVFRLRDAVETSRAIMSYQASAKQVELECDVGDADCTVHADRRALQQILINLLSNAVKFTPAGGKVSVRAVKDGSRLKVMVADTGIGISKDDLVRIGKPFVQVLNQHSRAYEGTGLGLSLVRGLVELQDGSMSIESAPGRGTSVEITIPCDTNRSEDTRDAEILTIPPAGKTRSYADETFRRSA